MTTIATICARGGSKGLPGKNIRPLMGKPLIAHTIEQALSSDIIDAVYVSTDSAEIAEVAKTFGAIVPFLRPAELATSEAGKLPVIEHLVDHVVSQGTHVTRIIDLDPTSPLRLLADIEGAASLLDEQTDAVITGYASDKNPYFNMVEDKGDGQFGLVKKLDTPVLGRQAAPKVFSMNASIYVWHHETLKKGLFTGQTRFFEMPRERSIDIDSELDFEFVQLLMQRKRGDKNV